MDENGTRPARLLRRQSDGKTFVRIAPPAEFLSHIISGERRTPAPERGLARDPVGVAIGTYASGSRIAVRRMPAGYRTTIVA